MAVFNGSAADIESKLNKTNSISANPSDEKYPSEKAVKDYVDNNAGGSAGGGGLSEEEVYDIADRAISDFIERENPEWQGNKTTLIDENADDISYPSASAVKNYVEGQVGDIETALDSIIAIQEELIGGGGAKGPITFSIDYEENTFTADAGMTWAEWCDSEYNTIEAYVSEESERIYYVIDDEEWQLRDSSDDDVFGSDKIIADELYTGVM